MNDQDLETNRAFWDERAARHGQDAYYDVNGFLAGSSPLHDVELGLLPDVAGLDLLHLQCHFGLDTLAWGRRGARVTGVDFPYGGAAPLHFDSPGSYADPELDTVANDTVQHAHSLGEVVTAAAAAGLVVRELREYLDAEGDDRGVLVRRADGRYRLPFGDQYLPVRYSLVAVESSGSQPGA